MGVDTRIMLPEDVRVAEVAEAIGILAGLSAKKQSLGWGDSFACQVAGASATPSSIPTCCYINIKGNIIDGQKAHQVLFHFEPDDNAHYGRLMLPRSTAFWICVGRGLVEFFGGAVDYCDCDSVNIDYHKVKPRHKNNPSHGKAWSDFQMQLKK